jgi:subfamily B ATP-binding cassette protein MsbA
MTAGVSAGAGGQVRRGLAARLLKDYLAPHWRGLALALVCAAGVAALSAALGALLNPVVKRIFEQKRVDSLLLLTGLIVACGVLRGVLQVVQSMTVNRIGHRVVGEIQVALFGRLVRADLAQLRSGHSGGYVSSVLYDANLIREAATAGVVNYTREALTVVFAVGSMLFQDAYLTLVVLVAAPVAGWVMRRFSKRTRKATRGAMSETTALSTAVMESLDGVKLVKVDNRESYEEARVAAVVERRQRHIIKGANARAAAAPVTETLTTLVLAAVIFYAGYRATQHQMTIGRLVAFMALLGIASQSLRQVANLQTVFAEGLTAAARLFDALDVRPLITDRPGARPLALTRGAVRFEGASFSYAPDAPAVSEVTIEVGRGETAALVGPSGGGKSTLLNLIPRFYDVDSGRVTIDGVDVRDVTLDSLRAQIALVTQEPFLFDDTLFANIAYARPEATPAEVQAAAEAANAHDFITALPLGYQTLAGEAGTRLSGGQRQRIAIARAFLKDAPILLLDEATSALDTESERKVQDALERLMAGRTTLMVAHRLSTVRAADRIYVLEAGRIVESGTHARLIASGGLYSRLARSQHLDFAPAEPPRRAAGGAV